MHVLMLRYFLGELQFYDMNFDTGSLGDQMTVRSGAMGLWAKMPISAPRYGVDARPPPFEPDTVAEFGGPGQNGS